jgi:hypothetical protein
MMYHLSLKTPIAGNMIITTHLGVRLPSTGSTAISDSSGPSDQQQQQQRGSGSAPAAQQSARGHTHSADSTNGGAGSSVSITNTPSPHMQLEETCKLLRLGYHKVTYSILIIIVCVYTSCSTCNQ